MKKQFMVVGMLSVLPWSVQADGLQVYQETCAACHDQGVFGAPRVGNNDEWAKRISKGKMVLSFNAIQGYVGSSGVMPAKGGNPALTEAQIKEAVQYMIDQSW